MQQVFSDTNKVLIDAKNNGNLMYLPLDKLMSQEDKPKPKAEQEPEQHVDAVSSQRNTNNSSFNGRMSREERIRQGRE